MRILVVEQDVALGQFLARALRSEQHEAEWMGDGEAALVHAERHELDLMVVDLLLPNLSGLELLEHMEVRHSTCSLIVLMAEDLVETRVRCLNLGADDCVVKPFSLQELVARCNAQLRRRSRLSGATLQHGSVVLRRKDRTVLRDGIATELTGKEFALLEHLVELRGRCASRSELLREVFHLPEDSPTNVVEVYINYLRRKLTPRDQVGATALIETVRGSGYRLAEPSSSRHVSPSSTTMLKAASL